jgi:hypothetical protein
VVTARDNGSSHFDLVRTMRQMGMDLPNIEFVPRPGSHRLLLSSVGAFKSATGSGENLAAPPAYRDAEHIAY